MQVNGWLRRIRRDGYDRTLEVVGQGGHVYWIGATANLESFSNEDGFAEGSELSVLMKVQHVSKVYPQKSSTRYAIEQSIIFSPHCKVSATVVGCPSAYSFLCSLDVLGPVILVETENRQSLKVGQAVEFTEELAVVEPD